MTMGIFILIGFTLVIGILLGFIEADVQGIKTNTDIIIKHLESISNSVYFREKP